MSLLAKLKSLFNSKKPQMQLFPSPAKITRYGYPGDRWSDTNSSNAIGCYDNKLDENSLAISPDVKALFLDAGIKLGHYVHLYFSPTHYITRRWDDLTANDAQAKKLGLPPLRGRLDIFCPKDQYKDLDGKSVIGFQKV